MTSDRSYLFFRLLQLSAFTVFLGRAWQHLYWDAPFRTLFWDEQLLSGIILRFTDMDWETYSTSMTVDENIVLTIKIFGLLYLVCAIVALLIRRIPRVVHHLLVVGSIGLIFLAWLYCKEKFYSLGQFFEYALQFSSPLFLWSFMSPKSNKQQEFSIKKTSISSLYKKITPQFFLIMKIAIALTFISHGLYAFGIYPIPANFLEMTMNIMHIGEDNAKTFLKSAGILDFIVSVGIFLPWKWARFFLIYAIFWGFGTSIARVWANFNWAWIDHVLLQWLHESIMRMSHFLIPLAVFYGKIPKKTPQ